MTERMTDERFDQLCNFASHPGIKPWITELAAELAVYRAENTTLRAEVAKMKKEIERLRRTTHCIVCQRNATRMVGKSS